MSYPDSNSNSYPSDSYYSNPDANSDSGSNNNAYPDPTSGDYSGYSGYSGSDSSSSDVPLMAPTPPLTTVLTPVMAPLLHPELLLVSFLALTVVTLMALEVVPQYIVKNQLNWRKLMVCGMCSPKMMQF
ncbi:GSCOCG00004307001-RA-CDS [Cotesia congregata]|nr:GSCOCG00004307001-RA-CDS [Cotesia congregata]